MGHPSAKSRYKKINLKRQIVLLLSAISVLTLLVTDLSVGSSSLSFFQCLRLLLAGPKTEGTYSLIVWGVRLPMTLTCMGVGGCLAIAGLQVQTLSLIHI